MNGFEVIVRPVVLPNIRPAPAQALLPEDAPDKGIAVISGSGGKVIDLPFSRSSSWTKSRMVEVMRKFDKVRVYATKPDGTFDRSEYVEYEVLVAIQYLENGQTAIGQSFAHPFESEGVEVVERGMVRFNDA